MQVERDFLVGISDVDFDNRLTNRALIESFSNMANIHGALVGFGSARLSETSVSWVVLNWKLEVYQRPMVCETYKVITWPQSFNRLKAFRDFEVLNSDDEVIARASSLWVAVDPKTLMPLRLTEEIMAPYGSEVDRQNFPDYKPAKGIFPEGAMEMKTVKILRSMIDCNHHVHNSVYLDLVTEVLPENINPNDFSDIEVVYKKEIKPGDEVQVSFIESDGVSYGVIRSFSSENVVLHAVIIMKK